MTWTKRWAADHPPCPVRMPDLGYYGSLDEYERSCDERYERDHELQYEIELHAERARGDATPAACEQAHAEAHLEEEHRLWTIYVTGISARPTRTFCNGCDSTPVYRY